MLNRVRCLALPWLAVGLPVILASPIATLEGAIEISAARVSEGDVTGSGVDLAGFPATLDLAGTYVLISNLIVASWGGIPQKGPSSSDGAQL